MELQKSEEGLLPDESQHQKKNEEKIACKDEGATFSSGKHQQKLVNGFHERCTFQWQEDQGI